jgi:hypothetical protein
MDEYVCITVLSNPGESEAEFSARLSRFWTHMLRTRKADFEKVYAETTVFERSSDHFTRQYLAEIGVVGLLEKEMGSADIALEPISLDEIFSKYEAVSPDWMQIEH